MIDTAESRFHPDLATVPGLLAHIADLPPAEAAEATARVDAALDGPAPAARLALGILALDLAGRLDHASDDALVVVPEMRSVRVSA